MTEIRFNPKEAMLEPPHVVCYQICLRQEFADEGAD